MANMQDTKREKTLEEMELDEIERQDILLDELTANGSDYDSDYATTPFEYDSGKESPYSDEDDDSDKESDPNFDFVSTVKHLHAEQQNIDADMDTDHEARLYETFKVAFLPIFDSLDIDDDSADADDESDESVDADDESDESCEISYGDIAEAEKMDAFLRDMDKRVYQEKMDVYAYSPRRSSLYYHNLSLVEEEKSMCEKSLCEKSFSRMSLE